MLHQNRRKRQVLRGFYEIRPLSYSISKLISIFLSFYMHLHARILKFSLFTRTKTFFILFSLFLCVPFRISLFLHAPKAGFIDLKNQSIRRDRKILPLFTYFFTHRYYNSHLLHAPYPLSPILCALFSPLLLSITVRFDPYFSKLGKLNKCVFLRLSLFFYALFGYCFVFLSISAYLLLKVKSCTNPGISLFLTFFAYFFSFALFMRTFSRLGFVLSDEIFKLKIFDPLPLSLHSPLL